MNCRILHERPGRLRVHMRQCNMSLSEADRLEEYLKGISGVIEVKVYERTADAVICYHFDSSHMTEKSPERESILRALSAFDYDRVPELPVPHSSARALQHEYEDRMARKFVFRALRKLFLPVEVRQVLAVIKALPRLWRGLCCLLHGRLDVEVLDAVSIGVRLLRGDHGTASQVTFLLGVGELIDEWTHKKSVNDLAEAMALNVDQVWMLSGDGTKVLVPIRQIQADDRILVETGNLVPLDGVILEGDCMVNQSSLTGESVPVPKGPGKSVYAGTVIEEGSCSIRVTKAAGSNKYDQIVRMIEDSEKLKSDVESRASHLADRLVPWCLGLSALTYLLTRNATRAVSVLMVDFSCALKLSMPLSVLSAMREASRYHITVKGGKFMEKVADATTVIFDKTGTLTNACPTVVDVIPFNGQDANEMLRVAACLEEHFPHSMANAVVRAAREKRLDHEEMHSKVEYLVAHGIATKIGRRRAIIGSYHFVFEDEGTRIRKQDRRAFEEIPAKYSCLYLAIGGVLSAVICISDPLRPEARDVIRRLHEVGIEKCVMLTGDSRRTAEAIAEEVGVDDFRAEVLPEDKSDYIRAEQALGHTVIMIGDGINDAPALSLADVGVAIGSGAMIAREVADITIAAEDLTELFSLKQLSDALMRRIQNNYRFVMSFNGGLIGLGAVGLMPPGTSAMLHNGSTLLLSVRSMTNLL